MKVDIPAGIRVSAAVWLVCACSLQVSAQRGGGDPGAMADRFFGMLDRNQDGRIDEDEARRMPPPIRDAMQNMGADLRRGLSRDRFAEMIPRAMEEMRRSRESGGGPGRGGPSGGGPPGGFGGGPPGGFRGGPPGGGPGGYDRGRGDGRGPGDYRGGYDDRSRDDRSRDGRSRSRDDGRSKSGRYQPKPQPRVTLDLPEKWKSADLDGDGQIGLYEWDRKKYSDFYRFDTNGDRMLTPREISRASDASPAPAASLAGADNALRAVTPSRPGNTAAAVVSTRPVAAAVPATANGTPLVPAEFDSASAEGRWAKYVFKKLDRDKDGALSEKEWNASRSTRESFAKQNAQLTFPAKFDDFAGLMVAVQRAERKK